MKNTTTAVLSLFAFAALGACKLDHKTVQKPNVLLINIDDMGWKDVGFMGTKFYKTPNIDKLAHGGMIFTQAYAGAANCAPSRACLMSGQWTTRHDIYTVGSSERGKSKDRKLIPTPNKEVLSEDNYLLTEALKEAGYITCHAGKWHITEDPTTKGIDVNIGGCHAGNPGSYRPPYTKVPLSPPAENKDQYLTDLVMDKTLDFVDGLEDEPFFLYYSPYAVHTPIQAIDSLLPKYDNVKPWHEQNNKKYATMVENLDRNIGRLISKLEEKDMLKNTLIMFMSDNGGVYSVTRQRPLRAGKGSYYEGGIREPMFVYWEGVIKGGSVSDVPVTNLDFYPTILEALNIQKPEKKILDGNSLLSVLKQEGSLQDRPLFWHFPIYLQGGNEDTQDLKFRTRPGSAIRYKDWKLIQYFENNDVELYDLKNDIGEKVNLVEQNPDIKNKLLKMLDEWRDETNAPVPSSLNPDFKN